jgi:hypothetical protein
MPQRFEPAAWRLRRGYQSVGGVEGWRWSSVNEHSGMSAAQQMRRCGLTIASLPLDSKARI